MKRDIFLHIAIICFFICAAILSFYLIGDAISSQQAEMQGKYQEQYNSIMVR